MSAQRRWFDAPLRMERAIDLAAGSVAVGATAIAGVLVANGIWAVWEEGFNMDATLRLGLGIVACVIAILLIFRLVL
jgi:hypothetical protein